MVGQIDPDLVYNAAFIVALIFFLVVYLLIGKVLDIFERKRKDY